jgi:hypothetical protein
MAGQRIDDHSFWAGKAGKNMVMPQGVHTKELGSDGHAGELSNYEDTNEAIKKQQNMNVSKIKGHPQRPVHRY